MQRKIIRCFLSFVLVVLAFPNQAALSIEDAQLLRKEYQQYHAWVLSRDYLFGTTLKPEPIKALAWQLIYVGMLPASYPGKEKLLDPYKRKLLTSQLVEATQLAQTLRHRYALQEPFTEEELYRVYSLHENNVSWADFKFLLPSAEIRQNFNKWLDWLKQNNHFQNALEIEQVKHELDKNNQHPIVYGHVMIQGPEPLEMVRSEVKLSAEGFFISHPNDKTISFALPGYKTVTVSINKKIPLQGIPPVILIKQGGSKKTGVVGRVLPWAGVEGSNIVLRWVTSEIAKEPWYRPVVPLTVTLGGQFYATGLSPGRYELVITTRGLNTSKQFTVKENEIRGLSLIDLRKVEVRQS
ncbi:hypothetical protein B6N58_06275 [Legionella micdadei]|uniref:hypothetical protein n=1 Tax=Legionella micdadei TaxID=451 RepID=UPI0009EF6DFF|nr:hypothetical protein [Legionella micdadei]ARG97297.1 hypothetical protein B6N58_06275 [Legionella micdadei]NSL16806.1 hypothetical protein [Legionella micdadei]